MPRKGTSILKLHQPGNPAFVNIFQNGKTNTTPMIDKTISSGNPIPNMIFLLLISYDKHDCLTPQGTSHSSGLIGCSVITTLQYDPSPPSYINTTFSGEK
jgi:hypothetical protein